MNKEQFVAIIQKNMGDDTTKVAATNALNATLKSLQEVIASAGALQLVGFGTFLKKTRKARIARNPSTGKELKIPAKNVVLFRAGKHFKEAINTKKK